MIKLSNAVILAVAITLLLNIQIFAGRGSIALGGILIGSIWIILIGLLIYAATLTKKLALQILLVALAVFCLSYPALSSWDVARGKVLGAIALAGTLAAAAGSWYLNEKQIIPLLIPLAIWLTIANVFLTP